MSDTNGDSNKLKSTLLICTTLIAFASLVLNTVQYLSSRQVQTFESSSKHPAVNTFRLKFPMADILKIRSLAQEGVEFSYISNPSFLLDNKLRDIEDEAAVVEFLVITNDSDVALLNLKLAQAETSPPELKASHLGPHSTLLVPETVYWSGEAIEPVSSIFQISYDFLLGGNELSDTVRVAPPSDEIVVFEAGLGAIAKSSFDFEEE